MRVSILLEPEGASLRVPKHYNAIVQGLIYYYLDEALATRVHDVGYPDGKRQLKYFTFSRLMGNYRLEGDYLYFEGSIRLVVCSMMREFLESLVLHLLDTPRVQFHSQRARVKQVYVEPEPPYAERVIVRTLSPITVYSTFETPNGKKKTYYYAPQESEFEEQLLLNLQRKVNRWHEREVPMEGASIKPYRVSARNQHILYYKETVVKAWSGLYELCLPPEHFEMAFSAGLGSKNSQGFGCIALAKQHAEGETATPAEP
ncbi:MAG: CRISPR-associated endoribonuclease Cas6 [Fimbriimonadales bacterium]